MFKFKRKAIYSQLEIANHIGLIEMLIKQRAIQLKYATSAVSDVKQQKYLEEAERTSDNIESAQLVLNFMLEKNLGT